MPIEHGNATIFKEDRMLKRLTAGALALAAGLWMAALPAQQAQAAGPDKALVSCTICHDVTKAKTKKVGPGLFGVYGKKPSIAGVPFSKWDDASLDKWLTDAQKVKPSTAMTFKVGDAGTRKATIAALKALK
jgi:cytochrome c